jgi:acetyltransferase-like isoleucine patch superfamily enzyme
VGRLPGDEGRAGPAPLAGRAAARGRRWVPVFAASAALVGGLPLLCLAAALAPAVPWLAAAATPADAALRGLAVTPLVVLGSLLLQAAVTLVVVRLLAVGLRPGHSAVRSRTGWQAWCTLRLLDEARSRLFPLYSSLLTPHWLRLLGARIGRGVEASTVLLLPSLTTVGDGAFLADDTMVGAYELGGGWLHVERTKIGKRAFLGNSGMTAPGRRVRKHGLVAVLSAAPERAEPGSSWLGSPPVRLRRTEQASDEGPHLRPAPPPGRRPRGRRGAAGAAGAAERPAGGRGRRRAGCRRLAARGAAAGPVLLAAGLLAAATAVLAKWLLVGRVRAGEHPLWSGFVWRNELADTFVEVLARRGSPAGRSAPRSATPGCGRSARRSAAGCGARRTGCRRPTWCAWATARPSSGGCVLQTHLFHDRVLSTDRVELGAGATLGPHGVVLPAARVGAGATVGPASLVVRGDRLPPATRWLGNPVAPWHQPGSAP